MDINQILHQISIWIIPVLFAITLHEVAHGWVALKFGDRTAQMLGRLSLNPIKHIDPIGTILVPLSAFFLAGFIFGWAKPVPVNAKNLNNPKTNMFWVALAGPLANLLMALFWLLIFKLLLSFFTTSNWFEPAVAMTRAGIIINLILMIFNLLPIPPLDGGKILASILPNKYSWQLYRLENYGMFIIIGLFALGLLEKLISPVLQLFLSYFSHFLGPN